MNAWAFAHPYLAFVIILMFLGLASDYIHRKGEDE